MSTAFAAADDGTRLFVRTAGPAKVEPDAVRAVLCDGIACDGFIWKYLWDDLARSMPVVHWHYRGHGRSAMPADPDRVDVAAHAEDLAAVRRFVGDPPCVLFGHSMGCQVVLEELRRHRERVRGLVLMCGSYGRVTKTFRGVPILEMILPKVAAAVKKNEPLVRALWGRIPSDVALKLALKAGDLDPEHFSVEDLRPYVMHVREMDLPLFLRMLTAAGEHSAEDLLPTVDMPALVVAGERDTFTPLFLAEAMAKAMPGAELFVVKNGSHVAPLEQHELVDERIRAFLRDRVRAT
jgi:pimeloyl-ACP methyl ester carboxylesterase